MIKHKIIFSTHKVSIDSWTGDKEKYFKKYWTKHVVTMIQTTIYRKEIEPSGNMSCWLAGLFLETESTIWIQLESRDQGWRLHMQPLRPGCCVAEVWADNSDTQATYLVGAILAKIEYLLCNQIYLGINECSLISRTFYKSPLLIKDLWQSNGRATISMSAGNGHSFHSLDMGYCGAQCDKLAG